MLEGDFADMCANKFSLVLLGGQAEGLACADWEARTPIGFRLFAATKHGSTELIIKVISINVLPINVFSQT